jgi:hypothetical protein
LFLRTTIRAARQRHDHHRTGKEFKVASKAWTSDEENKLGNMLDAGKTADEIVVELRCTRQSYLFAIATAL